MQAENAELKDRFLRAAAEMENLRRRTERDVKDARSYSISGFARDMLAVSDNLRRALEAVPQEERESGDESFKALLEGVEMTERSMQTALERHGVSKIEPEGQKFDPNFHQAMFEVPNADVPNNTVVQVVQAGYVIGERVLRPAMVGVAKGGPKPRRRRILRGGAGRPERAGGAGRLTRRMTAARSECRTSSGARRQPSAGLADDCLQRAARARADLLDDDGRRQACRAGRSPRTACRGV